MKSYDTQFIDGRFVPSRGTSTREVINPFTEAAIGTVALASAEDVDAAVRAARSAFGAWSVLPKAERVEILTRIAAEIERRADDLAATISAEVGTPIGESRRLQVGLAQATLQISLGVLADHDPDAYTEVANSRVYKEPVGVVGVISPWNYPLVLSLTPIASALAAGCTVVHKPSEVTPLNALLFAEITQAAGLPAGVLNVVVGDGPTAGEALVAHPDVDMIAFTGSTRAGKRVYELSAGTVKNMALELGGKSANVILPDADLNHAVEVGVRQVFFASGQACFAWSRMLVPRDRLADAEKIAAEVARSYVLGSPNDPSTTLGPLVSKAQQERVRGYIQSAIHEGADVVVGGPEQPGETPTGYFVQGTVLSNVTPAMTVAQEEIFGPVVCLMPYDTEEDAIAIANDTELGLHGGVFSADVDRATTVARRLRTGRVDINGAPNNLEAPFGGYRQSGIGREFGEAGFDEYLVTKAIQY